MNHPGGGATAAPALVAQAPADGNTLLVDTSAHAYSAAATSDLLYHPVRDFVAVAPLTIQAYVLVAGAGRGLATLSELVAAAEARPGVMTFGSTGVGMGTHVGTQELSLAAGLQTVHMPAGPADAITDVIAKVVCGALDYAMSPISIAALHIADSRLAALGVTTARRSPALPQVPTIAEAGVAGYDFPIWYGGWVPAGTPPRLVEHLSDDIGSAIAEPDVRRWLVDHGMEPMSMTPDEFARFVIDEQHRAARILGIQAATISISTGTLSRDAWPT